MPGERFNVMPGNIEQRDVTVVAPLRELNGHRRTRCVAPICLYARIEKCAIRT